MHELRKFIVDCRGVSSIEFAIGLPMLALVLAGIVSGWTFATQALEMRKAVKNGSNYVLQGGVDIAAAKSAVLTSWPNKPQDASVTVSQNCTCAGKSNSCSTVCSDGTAPKMSMAISATGSVDMPLCDLFMASKYKLTRSETIRVK